MFRRSGFYVMVIVLTATIVRNASRSHPKIIGGHPISIRQRPFMLSLHNSHRFICGASILSQKLGITALHCLISATSMEYHVRAGSTKINKGGTIHNITNVYIYNDSFHSQLYPKMLRHDIVIFKVSPHFQFSKMVRPVLLAKTIEKPPAKLFVSGWGYSELRTDDDSHGNLMGVYVHHVPFEICVKATPDYAVLVKKDYHLCYGTPGRDSCYGDSGGPLANRNTLYGIVSFGYSCGEVSGVYVKVSYYRRWIKEIMKS